MVSRLEPLFPLTKILFIVISIENVETKLNKSKLRNKKYDN